MSESSIRNPYSDFRHRTPNFEYYNTRQRRTIVPANLTPNGRYSVISVGGYRDEAGIIYNFKYIGGQITDSVTLYRMPVINRGSNFATFGFRVINNIALLMNRLSDLVLINLPELSEEPLYGEVYDNYELFRQLMDRVEFSSGYDLRKYFEIDSWGPIVRGIYEHFERSIAGTTNRYRLEKFIIPTFADYNGEAMMMCGTMHLRDGTEVYISPPQDTYSVVSRIVYTKSAWLALCNLLGYSDIGATLLWEEIYHIYSNQKNITLENILDFIASEGFSPCMAETENETLRDLLQTFGIALPEGPSMTRGLELMMMIVLRLLILKFWHFTRQSLDLPDWKQETKYTVFARDMPDEQYDKQIAILKEEWVKSQLRVPDGSLGPKAVMNIMPITNEHSLGYEVYHATDHIQSDSKEYVGFPSVRFNEIRFDLIHNPELPEDESRISAPDFHPTEQLFWVQLKTLNYTEREMFLMWNKMTGEIESADNSNQDFAIRYSVVFPVNLNMVIPVMMGLKFEQRHWKLLFRKTICIDAPIVVSNSLFKSFINQQSWLGPMKYLVTEYQFFKSKHRINEAFTKNSIESRSWHSKIKTNLKIKMDLIEKWKYSKKKWSKVAEKLFEIFKTGIQNTLLKEEKYISMAVEVPEEEVESDEDVKSAIIESVAEQVDKTKLGRKSSQTIKQIAEVLK